MEVVMPDRLIRDTHGTRAETRVLKGIVLAVFFAALLLLVLPRLFNPSEKSADVNTTQPNVKTSATDENKKP